MTGSERMDHTKQREQILATFNPDGPGNSENIFGLPFTPETAEVVLLPVPWEVTVSYHRGAVHGPSSILKASTQVDLMLNDIPEAWKLGIAMLPVPDSLVGESDRLRHLSAQHVSRYEQQGTYTPNDPVLVKINEACENLNIYVKTRTLKLLDEGKMVGVIGGDHSTPLGFMRALSIHHERFGILQIDAHADLRKSYQGFISSHASIMYNALKLSSVSKIVQVGIRDYSHEEAVVMQKAQGRITTFFDDEIKSDFYQGKTWDAVCDNIIHALPEKVYISFDIDGLDPKLCPNTGTPVAGGLEYSQAVYLLWRLVKSGRRIIGFDLCEVSPGKETDWDANVGARLLYQLCSWMGASAKKVPFR